MTLRTLRRQAEQAVAEASRRLQVATRGTKRQRELELRQARTAALKVGPVRRMMECLSGRDAPSDEMHKGAAK